ncbi:glycoside hydrolase [Apiospora arundinis]|uniref:chitinase n=1 Tax=Apiospora arundinis TaxID=335852 RepID=A0ABR2IS28_9PEZI
MRLVATLALLVGILSPQVFGDEQPKRPSCSVDSHKIDRVIGYYDPWSTARFCRPLPPYSITEGVYSHINFAYVSIDPKTFEVVPTSFGDDRQLYPFVRALGSLRDGLQVWLAIGGWTFNDAASPTATTFSDLARADITEQKAFFVSLLRFMGTWSFTGIDIDWKYPSAGEDHRNFPRFLKNLRAALDNYGYGLSVTIPITQEHLQHFDLAAIEPYVDWFNVESYDLHGTWDIGSKTKWDGAILNAHTNLTEIAQGLDLVWRQGISGSKITLGMAFYGRTATLIGSCNTPGCTYASAGDKGRCSQVTGILANTEIAEIIKRENLTPTLYKDAAVKTITWGDQWASFDDKETFKLKGDFAKSQCLGGVAVWAISHDDGMGTIGEGLMEALGNELKFDEVRGGSWAGTILDDTRRASNLENPQDKYCRWIGCGEQCPNGFTQIVQDDKKSEIMMDASAFGQAGFPNSRVLCCPTSDPPTCRWRGHSNTGRCEGGCSNGEVEVGFTKAECSSGHQTACCSQTESTAPWGECRWTGCTSQQGECPSDYPNFVVAAPGGSGGLETCLDATRNYCCKGSSAPKAFTRCSWYATPADGDSGPCMDCCPGSLVQIASDVLNIGKGAEQGHGTSLPYCDTGNKAFCCAGDGDLIFKQDPQPKSGMYRDQVLAEFDALLQKYLASQVPSADSQKAQHAADGLDEL